jgi:hypothetical protein
MRCTALTFLIALFPAALTAQTQPICGTYTSTDIGGEMLPGRFSYSWMGGGEGAVGNVMNIQSWDGTTFGTQWSILCPSQYGEPSMISNTLDQNGTGELQFDVRFVGGSLRMAPSCPWNPPGANEQTLTGLTTIVTSTHQYVGGVRISRIDEFVIYLQYWSHYDFVFSAQNIVMGGFEISPGYPPYLDGDCTHNDETLGLWGDSVEVTVETCHDLPVQSTTWGQIKAMYQ